MRAVYRAIRFIFLIINAFSFHMFRYKQAFMELRNMKTEIEHLQHLLEKAKVKMMKDFELWWAEQSTQSQVCSSTLFNVFFSYIISNFRIQN